MMKHLVGAVLMAATAGSATAQLPAPRTVQQDFEAATGLDATADPAAALAAWQALAKRVKPGSRNAAIIRLRIGDALFRQRRMDEADADLRGALAALPTDDPSLRSDRARGWLLIGTLAHNTLDYAGAAKAFATAEELEDTPVGKLRALLAQAQVLTFTDPVAASRALQRADAIVAGPEKIGGKVKAFIAQRRAELLMNQGDFNGARLQATAAVRAQGGMTERTSVDDVPARADAGLAYILAGKPDAAREYMGMTGAGRLPKGDFGPAAYMAPPDCGGEANLKPDDVAVIQFNIADDGAVHGVEPIYAAGGGQVALEFARAARTWSWPASEIAAIPPFFRRNVRVEMRCSTAFARPSIYERLYRPLREWVGSRGHPMNFDKADASAGQVDALRAALQSATDPAGQLVAAWKLARNDTVSREESAMLDARALQIARQERAPMLARLALDLLLRESSLVDSGKPGAFDTVATALLAEPEYASDPQARAAILLMQSDFVSGRDKDRKILDLLRPVANAPGLDADDPLRVGVLIRIASAEQRMGNVAAAQAAFHSTGMSADQCAILDKVPQMKSMLSADAFPAEAVVWGFEGWTTVEFDIKADGRTAKVRSVLSYPPFIFSQASKEAFATARYEATYRPDGAAGCGGLSRRIVFRLPG